MEQKKEESAQTLVDEQKQPNVEYGQYVDKNGKVWRVKYVGGSENLMDIAARILPDLL